MNRTNIMFSGLALVALLVIGSAQSNRTTSPASGQVGRYQLLYGEHEVSVPTGPNLIVKGVFRIDTVTGATSFYSNILPDKSKNEPYINEWHPINEFTK